MSKRTRAAKIEFGDFQTPAELANRCCRVVRRQLGSFATVIEPTCGEGAFVAAAMKVLQPQTMIAYELHARYIASAKRRTRSLGQCEFKRRDFFDLNWTSERKKQGAEVLFLGNPPWVTNSQLGVIDSSNAPRKSNVEGLRGIDAMTGRSNFDISESVLQTLLAAMRPDHDSLAMLVKSATARKVLRLSWKGGMRFQHVSLHPIDSKQHFGVHVDACLLLLQPCSRAKPSTYTCHCSPSLESPADDVAFGWFDDRLVADPKMAEATRHLRGDGGTPWRSGVKHDLAGLLELTEHDGGLVTRDDQPIEIERDRVYPLAKGSDVANRRIMCPLRRLLVPQRRMNESSDAMSTQLPKTYRYLQGNIAAFRARKSSIYRNRDPFAVFGIGDYTFAPWKVAICGLYKRLTFTVFGPIAGRPVVFDDTTYLLSFDSENEASKAQQLLESDVASQFFNARVFWDAKRPITAELLRCLDLTAVSKELGVCRNLPVASGNT